jgi:pimeloyl-ACP methyl ester carboxylesterase
VATGRLPRKQKLQAGARSLEYILAGRGSPAVLLFSGAGVTLEGWAPLLPRIERLARVLAWNRPGLGRSSPARRPQDSDAVLQDLRLLLEALQVEPPYVLVGHSLGGLHAQLFARRHPQEVAGLVLVESLHADDRAQVKGHAKRLSGVLARQLHVSAQELRPNIEAETAQVDASAAELDAAGPFPAAPLAAITGGKLPPAWLVPQPVLRRKRAHQKALARLSPRGVHVVAQRSGHFPQLTQPALVLDAIASVVEQARAAAR